MAWQITGHDRDLHRLSSTRYLSKSAHLDQDVDDTRSMSSSTLNLHLGHKGLEDALCLYLCGCVPYLPICYNTPLDCMRGWPRAQWRKCNKAILWQSSDPRSCHTSLIWSCISRGLFIYGLILWFIGQMTRFKIIHARRCKEMYFYHKKGTVCVILRNDKDTAGFGQHYRCLNICIVDPADWYKWTIILSRFHTPVHHTCESKELAATVEEIELEQQI